MSYFQDFPNTNFYNQDLGWLIKKYKELNGDVKILQQIYDMIKEQIKDITLEQLQKWLDDGTLANIINQELLKSKLTTYDNVNAFKTDETLKENDYFVTKGYYSEGDGGAGCYIIKNSKSPHKYYETLNNGLFAELLCDKYNVLSMGVFNDGETDNADLLQTLFNLDLGTYIFPVGTYIINKRITPKQYTKIIGSGSAGINQYIFDTTTVFKTSLVNDCLINLSDREPFAEDKYASFTSCEISNIVFLSTSNTPICIYASGHNHKLNRVQFLEFNVNIYCDFLYHSYFENIGGYGSYMPIVCRYTTKTLRIKDSYFGGRDSVGKDSQFENAYLKDKISQFYYTGLQLEKESSVTLENVSFEKFVYGISIEQNCNVLGNGVNLELITRFLYNFNNDASHSNIVSNNMSCYNTGTAPYDDCYLTNYMYYGYFESDMTIQGNVDFTKFTNIKIKELDVFCIASCMINGQPIIKLPFTLSVGSLVDNYSYFNKDVLYLSFIFNNVSAGAVSIDKFFENYSSLTSGQLLAGYILRKNLSRTLLTLNTEEWDVINFENQAMNMAEGDLGFINVVIPMKNNFR